MRLKFILLLCLLTFLRSQAQQLSKASTFSILTVDPSDELYTSFGHSALRLTDSIQKTDIVFNWGIFNFNTPNFYLKFASGKLDYMLAVESFQSFMVEMYERKTGVVAQNLNLTIIEKEKLLALIQKNYLPENRFYKYDFFYDNCSTRIRDIILTALNRQYSLELDINTTRFTYRELCDECVRNKPWIRLGIDLLLGMPSDQKADLFQAMYLPANLYSGFKKLYKNDKNPIVLNEVMILKNSAVEKRSDNRYPMIVLITIAFLFCFSLPWLGKFSPVLDGLFFSLIGLLGWLLLAMWFLSDHEVMHNNLNVLWAFPLHLFYFIIVNRKSWSRVYFIFSGSLALIVMICFPILPQEINTLIIPIILVLIIRSYSIAFKLDNRIRTYFISLKNV
jgi:hypothetical protein